MKKNKKDNGRLRAATEALSTERRELGRDSVLKFGQTYLRHYFRLSPSALHREMAQILERASADRGYRIAIAAPRGHAKSTLVETYILWCICYGLESCIVILSNTAAQAAEHLAHIKHELEGNPMLLADFPGVCEPRDSKPGPPRWTQSLIITRNNIKVTALGAGQDMRGLRHNQFRPGLIVLDDVENREAANSAERREKLFNWLMRDVVKAGDDRTNIILVGTILHYDSLLAKLTDESGSFGWVGHRYKAVISWFVHPELWEAWELIYTGREADEQGNTGPDAARSMFEAIKEDMMDGVEVLWSQRESFYDLMVMRITEGRASFDAEKQNEPVDPSSCLFREEDIVLWDADGTTEDELLDSLQGHCSYIGACDPSMGKAGKGRDDSAIITLVRDTKTGTLYVVDADIARRTPLQIIEAILAYHKRRKYVAFGVEAVQFQAFFATELQRESNAQGLHLPVKKIKPTSDKLGRIQSLQPLIKSGTIRFSKRHRTLLDQLRQFPKAAHDDGPDALEMAVGMAGTARSPGWAREQARHLAKWNQRRPPNGYGLGWHPLGPADFGLR